MGVRGGAGDQPGVPDAESSHASDGWAPRHPTVADLSLDHSVGSRERRTMHSITRPSKRTPPRWRVCLLGDMDGSLHEATAAGGGMVVLETAPPLDGLWRLSDAAVDVVILRPPPGLDLSVFASAPC